MQNSHDTYSADHTNYSTLPIKNFNTHADHHYHHREKPSHASKIGNYYPPLKAKRKRASPSQLSVLNRVFNQTYFPSTELRIELGKHLGMSPRTVQIWFQNKRQSLRSRTRQFSFSSAEDPEEEENYSQGYPFDLANYPSSPPWTPTSGSGPYGNDTEYPFILPPPSSSPSGSTSPVSMSSSPVMMHHDHHHHKINLPPLRLHKSHFYSSPVSPTYPSPISIDSILQ